MLKKIIIAVGIVFVLAVLVLGWEKTYSYVAGTRHVLNEEADGRSPMRLEKARIEVLIQKEQENILVFEDKVADLEGRRDETARGIEEANKKLASEKDLLKRIKALLDEKREQYTIGPNTYTYAEVNADALERVEEVRRIQEAVAFHETLLADLDTGIRKGHSSLCEARNRLTELKNGLARLEQRDVNARIRLQVAKLANAVAGAPLPADSELEKVMRNLERRVSAEERRATAQLSAGMGRFRIDYSAAMVTQDASAEIDRLLVAVTGSNPVTEAPCSRPSVVEVLENTQK
jgi:DNA repair exonuclease SbcCD ATPase subunit